jgi:hypothetical protein
VLCFKPNNAIALRPVSNGYPNVNLYWESASVGSFKLCFVPSNAGGSYKTDGQNSQQKYIRVTIANYTDAFFRGELDIFEGSYLINFATPYGIYPSYTDFLVRLLVNVKRLKAQIIAEQEMQGEFFDQLSDLKRRNLFIIAAMCDTVEFEYDLTPAQKILFGEIMNKQWDSKVPVKRRGEIRTWNEVQKKYIYSDQ